MRNHMDSGMVIYGILSFLQLYNISFTFTVVQAIVWNLTTNCAEDDGVPMMAKFPFVDISCWPDTEIEISQMEPRMKAMFTDSCQYAVDMPSPRLIKTHMPLSVLPPSLLDTAKVQKRDI